MINPIVSVIVPVYNRETTIEVCLRSILNQKIKNFEIIVINDGSKDSSGIICERLAEEDARIVYRYQDNQGVSAARNHGLSLAKGEWVTFVDSDDVILPDYLNIVDEAKSNADLLMVGYTSSKIESESFPIELKEEPNNRIEKNDVIRYLFGNEYDPYRNSCGLMCSKFFRNQIIQKYAIRFDASLSLEEDHFFLFNYLFYAKGIIRFTQPLYIIREDPHNIEHLCAKQRSLEEYFHIYLTNYSTLSKLNVSNNCPELAIYKTYYIVSRLICRIIYDYYYGKYKGLITEKQYKKFVSTKLIPFLQEVDVMCFPNYRKDILYTYYFITKTNLRITLMWVFFYHRIIIPVKLRVNRLYSLYKSRKRKIGKMISSQIKA